MSVFKVNDKLMSYRYSLLKIAIAIVMIGLLIYRPFIPVGQGFINEAITLVTVAIGIACFYIIAISFAEIISTYENREFERLKRKPIRDVRTTRINEDELISQIRDYPITDVIALIDSKVVKIGSSSDYNKSTDKFFDKLYYIDSKEFENIAQFEEALFQLIGHKDYIDIVSIDGIEPKPAKSNEHDNGGTV